MDDVYPSRIFRLFYSSAIPEDVVMFELRHTVLDSPLNRDGQNKVQAT